MPATTAPELATIEWRSGDAPLFETRVEVVSHHYFALDDLTASDGTDDFSGFTDEQLWQARQAATETFEENAHRAFVRRRGSTETHSGGFVWLDHNDVREMLTPGWELLSDCTAVGPDGHATIEYVWGIDDVPARVSSAVMAAKLEILQNKLTAIAEDVGTPLVTAVTDAIDASQPLIDVVEGASQGFSDMYSTGATSSSDPNSGRNFGGGYTVWYLHWLGSPNSSVASFREGVNAVTSVTIPARPYLAPRPPKSVALDCAGSYPVLTWAGDYDSSSSAQPWSGIYVSRSTDGGTAQRIASLSWSATNYTDSSVEAGHRYDYSVCSYNATGSSSTASAGTAYTAPTPFASVTLTATSTTSLSLAASGGSQWWDNLEWQLWSGGAWRTRTAPSRPRSCAGPSSRGPSTRRTPRA